MTAEARAPTAVPIGRPCHRHEHRRQWRLDDFEASTADDGHSRTHRCRSAAAASTDHDTREDHNRSIGLSGDRSTLTLVLSTTVSKERTAATAAAHASKEYDTADGR